MNVKGWISNDPPKAHALKTRSPADGSLLGTGGNFKRGAWLDEVGNWGISWELYGNLNPFQSLARLLLTANFHKFNYYNLKASSEFFLAGENRKIKAVCFLEPLIVYFL
jgi:hypothetical protein